MSGFETLFDQVEGVQEELARDDAAVTVFFALCDVFSQMGLPLAGYPSMRKEAVPSPKPNFPVFGHSMSLSRKAWAVIDRVYNEINVALWAVGAAGMVYLLLHIPEMRDARVRADAQLAQQISNENKFYCEKWGMPAGTHEHVICTMDLVRIRQETEQRIADEMNF